MRRAAFALALALCSANANADPITITVALIEVGASTAVAASIASIVSFVATYGSYLFVAGSYLYGNYQRRKAEAEARAKFLKSLEDRYVMLSSTDGARSRVYGKVRNVDGLVFKGTHGTDSEIYTLVISVAGHDVHAIGDIYFGDKRVTLDADGWVQDDPYKPADKKRSGQSVVTLDGSGAGSVTLPYVPVSGSVSCVQVGGSESNELSVSVVGAVVNVTGGFAGSAKVFYQYSTSDSNARVRKYLGGASQNLYSVLSPSFPDLTIDDRFAGDACLIVDLYYSQDSFPSGVPSISAVVSGAKILDPRTGTTAWTENLALHALDWAKYAHGGNLSSAQIDQDSFIAAANVCDISHDFDVVDDAGTTTVTDKLYRGGIVCKLEGDPTPYLAEICEGMAGRFGWSGGKLRVVAGGWRSSVVDIDESWFSDADIQIVPEPGIAEAVNAYIATIADETNDYIIAPLDKLAPPSYLAADGIELVREIEMQAVVTPYHAQNVCGVLLRESRQGLTISCTFNFRALGLELFDVVSITLEEFGWSAKTFEVQSWAFSPTGGIQCTLKETNATIYDPDADFSDLGWSDNTTLPDPAYIPLVTGLDVESGTSALVDGSIITRTRVTWDAVDYAPISQGGYIDVQYIEAGDSDTSGEWPMVTEPGGSTETIIAGLRTDRVYLFRVRARTALSAGQWSVQGYHKIGGPPAASINGTLTLPTATVSAASDGTVSSFAGTGGTFEVRRNAELVASGVTYSVLSEVGVDVSINASTGAYSVSSMSASDGSAVFRAVYDGVTLDRPYKITKSLAGADGASAPDIPAALPPGGASHTVSSGTATAGIRIRRNGDIERRIGSTYSLIGRWWQGSGSTPGDSCHVYFSFVSGTVGSGGGSWLALTSDREATVTKGSPDGTTSSTVLVQVSSDGGTTTDGSGNYFLNATYETAGP